MHVQQVARVHQGGYYVQALAIELHSHKFSMRWIVVTTRGILKHL
jgi:hypothetical protein